MEHRCYLDALLEQFGVEQNAFIEMILPGSILRRLGDSEKNAYGRPYLEPGEARRPTLSWPRELPIGGEPEDVVQIAQAYADWLSSSELPKLFINAEPGSLLREERREFCRSWPNQTEVTVPGSHFIQEDSPDEIGQAIAEWLSGLSQGMGNVSGFLSADKGAFCSIGICLLYFSGIRNLRL